MYAFKLNHVQMNGEDLLQHIIFNLNEKVEDDLLNEILAVHLKKKLRLNAYTITGHDGESHFVGQYREVTPSSRWAPEVWMRANHSSRSKGVGWPSLCKGTAAAQGTC